MTLKEYLKKTGITPYHLWKYEWKIGPTAVYNQRDNEDYVVVEIKGENWVAKKVRKISGEL